MDSGRKGRYMEDVKTLKGFSPMNFLDRTPLQFGSGIMIFTNFKVNASQIRAIPPF
jgi:hypothetical protein